MAGLEGSYPLSDEQLEELAARGHLVLRGVLTPAEIAHYRVVLRDYITAKEEILVGVSSAASAAEFYLDDAPEAVAAFVRSPRLGEIAARLLGVEAVRVLHFCGLFKPPGGPSTPWHQDLTFIPLDTDQMISLWLPLTDLAPEMGSLVFADGSHRLGRALGPNAWEGYERDTGVPMAAGDVSMHLGWTLHSARDNSTERVREAFGIGYYADGARIQIRRGVPFMQNLLDRYFSGLTPGDPAVGPMNPVVFSRQAP